MKLMKILPLMLWIVTLFGRVNAQPQTEDTLMVPFRRGEKLLYRVYFKSFLTGKVTAGDLTMEVTHNNRKFNGRGTYHLQCVGKSRGTFNWFMKIEDKFESYIDEKSLVPWYFARKIREGHYRKDEEVEFFPDQNLAISPNKVKKTPSMVQDILSAYYYTRTTNFTKMNPGEEFTLPIYFDDSIFVSKIICHNRETIQTQLGSFSCVSFRPMVMVGNVFKDRYPLTVWITDDENKVPVLVRSALVLGRIEIELVGSSGLAKPFLSGLDSKTHSGPRKNLKKTFTTIGSPEIHKPSFVQAELN